MPKFAFVLPVLLFSVLTLRADLVLEQEMSDASHTSTVILKMHGDQMRMDQSDSGISAIINLKTRDSYTLLTNKTFLFKFGSDVRWEMDEKQKYSHGTNEMDAPAAPAVDTGKSEIIDGTPAKIFSWTGAYGRSEKLWVATNLPNYNAIRAELFKLDAFNDSGPHRNAQPALASLPGMVVKSEGEINGHKTTTSLVSVKLEPVDPSLFRVPPDYTEWKRPEIQTHETTPPAH